MRSPAEKWRLILGRYADRQMGQVLSPQDKRRDAALDFLYGREYGARGLAGHPDQLRAIDWLSEAETLFPAPVFEHLRAEGLSRYNLTELLSDATPWESLPSSPGLLRALLSAQGRANPALRAQLRRIAERVVAELTAKLRAVLLQSLSGRRNRRARSPMASAANFDAARTIRANLAHWDPDRAALVIERLRFFARQKRHLDWTVVLCVDQSGSMTDSLIFSALMAAVLAGLPGVRVKMVLFDTRVVDVTDQLDDPLELLLSVQLGGGTDIAAALRHCEGLVENPSRTILALVSDFCEGGSPRAMLASVARMAEARVRQIGIAALDDTGKAAYDRDMGARLAEVGMEVAALTPALFADWLAGVVG